MRVEWDALVERGRVSGRVHAEDVTHVFRDVELTGDVLADIQEAMIELRDHDRRGGRRRWSTTHRPRSRERREVMRRVGGDDVDEQLLSRRRTRRTKRTMPKGDGRHVRRRADVPARDRPGRPAHGRRRASAGAADRGGQARRGADRRGRRLRSAVRGRRGPHADAGRQPGRAGQERADPGQPAARGEHRQAVLGPRACSCST